MSFGLFNPAVISSDLVAVSKDLIWSELIPKTLSPGRLWPLPMDEPQLASVRDASASIEIIDTCSLLSRFIFFPLVFSNTVLFFLLYSFYSHAVVILNIFYIEKLWYLLF